VRSFEWLLCYPSSLLLRHFSRHFLEQMSFRNNGTLNNNEKKELSILTLPPTYFLLCLHSSLCRPALSTFL
jgi:hypothetical protein